MRRQPRRRGPGRGPRDREAYQRQIAGSPAEPTAPGAAAPFPLESPDSTAAPTTRGARVSLQPIGGAPPRRRPRRRRWPWGTIWTAIGSIAVVIGLVCAGAWAVATLRADITANAVGLKGLEDKHNTFAARVADDFKRLESYVRELLGERRRDIEPPARRR